MIRPFHGGIVPETETEKEAATGQPFTVLHPPRLHIPLRARGITLTPCVEAGQRVKVGDVIATDPTHEMPPLHSGVSGTVTDTERSLPSTEGGSAPAVIVESDGKHTRGDLLEPLPTDASARRIVERMYEAGLVGMGGAGFPTHRKYAGIKAERLLINVCECEPYLAGDVRLALEQSHVMAQGARLLAAAAGVRPAHITFCTETEVAALSLKTTGLAVRRLPRRYPQGSERQLVWAVLGKEIPAGTPPSACGVMVSNAATAVAMGDAARGLPLTHRPVTVSGQVETPRNYIVPVGTPFSFLVRQIRPLYGNVEYLAGGPMTGRRLYSLEAGLPKTCGGLILVKSEMPPESPCIRCGACVRACPAKLMPFRIEEAMLQRRLEEAAAWHGDACISCGCCSYVCPAKRRLSVRTTAARNTLKGGKR